MATRLELTVAGPAGDEAMIIGCDALVIAGWAGRDHDEVMRHVRELAALGVAPPRSFPTYYRLSAQRLTQAARIDVVGSASSGEVEAVLVRSGAEVLITCGSDHTDRRLEAIGVTVAKEVCPKPLARRAWRWSEVAAHWDRIVLRSWVDGAPYQQGVAAQLRRPDELLATWEACGGAAPDGLAMFCGTVPTGGGLVTGRGLALELHDPVLGRSIRHDYAVRTLPIAEDA